jgi:hypothetical protein
MPEWAIRFAGTIMLGDDRTPGGPDACAEAFTAELTNVAYGVALRHAAGGTWVDLELELWRVLGDVVKKRRSSGFRAACMGKEADS